MKYTGRRAEYAVLAHLLAEEVEAYPAIKTNQDDYDITVVRADKSVIRVQVKGTDINTKGTAALMLGYLTFHAQPGSLSSRCCRSTSSKCLLVR